jgi:hypothetical protein
VKKDEPRERICSAGRGTYFEADDLYSQLYKKHFKKNYAGKPTKKYLTVLNQIEEAE